MRLLKRAIDKLNATRQDPTARILVSSPDGQLADYLASWPRFSGNALLAVASK